MIGPLSYYGKVLVPSSQILRRVREERETIAITHHGKVVARLVPVEEPTTPGTLQTDAIWTSIDDLAVKIGARWPAGISAAEAVSNDRREG